MRATNEQDDGALAGGGPSGRRGHERRARAKHGRRVAVVLAGASGQVGRALLAQLGGERSALAARGLSLRLVGAFNSSRQRWRRDGLALESVAEALRDGEPHDGKTLPARLAAARPRTVFVDCTASPVLARCYPRLLERGVAVVTPNKHAGSAPASAVQRLWSAVDRGDAAFLDSATVGAGLPILAAVRALHRRGESLQRFAGVLSGTLAFVLARVAEGAALHDAVAEAAARGYAEPDPRDDLRGEDVARKLLIVLRAAGLDAPKRQIAVESLVPATAESAVGLPALLARLRLDDGGIVARARHAASRGARLLYAACYDAGRATVGLREEPADSPLARAGACENVVQIWTSGYREMPLTIAGAGAGPEITARAVLGDILAAVERWVGSSPEARRRFRCRDKRVSPCPASQWYTE